MSVRDDQLDTLKVGGKDYDFYRIADLPGIDHLPYSLKVLVENLVRNIDGANITDDHVKALLDWDPAAQPSHEIQFTPSRVVMQDVTGVPCIVDLATMREAVARVAGRAKLEASGGITLARIPDAAATGVDFISVGALTHSTRSIDISMDISTNSEDSRK